ncbi:MAG: autotransporter adhesin family protein [Nitrososphaerota archaeon]|nr:autotransporter adhesin family protein [Nitrososphaerota archaeon]
MNVKSKFDLRSISISRKVLVFVSLLFTVALVFSCFIFAFNDISPFARPADNVVSNEWELRNAIINAIKPTVIALDNDITLTNSTLTIPAGKDITITSNGKNEVYKLIGVAGESTITIDEGGVLSLAGIVVTHKINKTGRGVTVNSGGILTMSGGEISGNTVDNIQAGGGVRIYDMGTFSLSGGKISDNTAFVGGGVYFDGTFTMSGGEISGNTAYSGGGVWVNHGSFNVYSGKISDNTAQYQGGGVYIGIGENVFKLFGGEVFGNTASNGGGIWVNIESLDKIFVSNSAVFSNNQATTAYNRDSQHDGVYNSNIDTKVVWTSPFTQGYNNYDIGYTSMHKLL